MSAAGGSESWIIATVIAIAGFVTTLIGGVVARDRAMSRQIREGDEKLHDRVNRIRDDMVHKDDLNRHLERMDRTLNEMRDEQREQRREMNMRLDQLLAKKSDV